ncbi:ABC transporter permease [Saccharibacillus sp. CPCC 101409]|uniref:ABC transporter permease n=1 Tax=Saccharibacillus sp. CPCC 101409 TaxID=3058041 RepID=UPI002673148B|nr:ABC transporter permease [Saccharibacillus sp. CPCC 101409]MDO3409425.1 ABC transporter permease [Saccharibacillus sp. CPCC 101409]
MNKVIEVKARTEATAAPDAESAGTPAVVRKKRHVRRRIGPLDIALGALIPVVGIAIWQFYSGSGRVDSFFLPSPLLIASTVADLGATGELFTHTGISLQRVLLGFLLGGGLGLIAGLLVGFSKRGEELFDPMLQLLRMTPNLAVAPLFILWFGFGELSKVVIIANGAFFPMYVNAVLGIRSVDNRLYEVSKVLAYSRFDTIRRLILPSSVPQLLLGVRLSLAVSWLSVVVAELINSTSGIGYLIYYGQYNSRTELIFVGILIFAVAGKGIDSLVRLLERRLLGWRDTYKG